MSDLRARRTITAVVALRWKLVKEMQKVANRRLRVAVRSVVGHSAPTTPRPQEMQNGCGVYD